jgi:hypothetical protein
VAPHEPSYTTFGPAESSQGRPDPNVEYVPDFDSVVLREDLNAALRFAEELQNNAARLTLFRWVGIIIAFASFIASALLLLSVIAGVRLGPALGLIASCCAAFVSTTAAMYFQRRLRTERRALFRTSQLLHEVAGSQQSSLSPIQRQILELRISRLDYAS